MKYFRMSYEEVVFKRSYLNLIMLNAAIPGHKPYNDKNQNKNDEIEEDDGEQSPEMHASNYFLNLM